jgi:iron complex transport system permease protein
MTIRRQLAVVVPSFGLVTLVVLAAAPMLGSTAINLARVFDLSIPWAENVDAQIFFVARLPRVLAGALVGSTLAAAGVVLQALLRNPLATPFTLGVSASAALGAMLAIAFNLDVSLFGTTAVSMASFAGSLVGTAIVYLLATRVNKALSTNVLLLAGVTLNTFFSALITLVQYLIDFADWYRTARWLLGNLDVSSYSPLVASLPLVGVSFVLFAMLPRALNLLSLGEDLASARGWMSGARSASRSSARRWRPAQPSRSPAPSASSASSCRTWSACWSGRTTAWCCRRRFSSAQRFWSSAT